LPARPSASSSCSPGRQKSTARVKVCFHPGRRYWSLADPNETRAPRVSRSSRRSGQERSGGCSRRSPTTARGVTHAESACLGQACCVACYRDDPSGLGPWVLCMTLTSSGRAGTRGSTDRIRRRSECFRNGPLARSPSLCRTRQGFFPSPHHRWI